MHKFILEDVVTALKEFPDNSIDYIVADPPYFIGFDRGRGWDDQWESEEEYLGWCREWMGECSRVLKPGRMLSVWGTLKTDLFLRFKLEVLNELEGFYPQNEIIWSYNWGGRSNKNFARKHQLIWNYSKGPEFLFNADDVRVARKVTKNIRTGEAYKKGTIPTCVWEANNHTMSKDFVGWHPTPKNIDLSIRLVEAYSNEGDWVVDLFAGSGAISLAAARTNRNSVAIEADPEYLAKAEKRVLDDYHN